MNKKKAFLAAVLALAFAMTGCRSGGENLAEKDYRALDYVKLGEYTALEVEQVEEKTELTLEEKESVLMEILENYAEDVDVTDRGAQNGDYLSMFYKCYQDNELIDESGEEPTEIQLGSYDFFDEEGEAQLMGCRPGETKTVELIESDGEEDYSYTYEVTVSRVYESQLPELDDAIAQTEGYDSVAAMETAVYQNALDLRNQEYQSAAKSQLVQLVLDASQIDGYPQSLYDKIYEQMDISYQDFFGMSLEDIYAGDEESLKAAVEETLNQELVVEALAEKENITVTGEELAEYKNSIVAMYDYADLSELEAEYSDDVFTDSLLNEKVQDFLLAKANVTYVSEEQYYGYYEETEDDMLFDDGMDEDIFGEEL